MKLFLSFAALAVTTTSAFTTVRQPFLVAPTTTKTSLDMGLLDFFSDDARKAREEKKRREVEEQERLQKEIMDRRRNPEKMEEYENKVAQRRQLRMAGKDDEAASIDMYDGADSNTLLDGTKGS